MPSLTCQPDPIISPHKTPHTVKLITQRSCCSVMKSDCKRHISRSPASAFQCSARKTFHNTVEGNKGSSITRHKSVTSTRMTETLNMCYQRPGMTHVHSERPDTQFSFIVMCVWMIIYIYGFDKCLYQSDL